MSTNQIKPGPPEPTIPLSQTELNDDDLRLLEAFKKDAQEEELMIKKMSGEISTNSGDDKQ